MNFAFAGSIIGSGFNKPQGLAFYLNKREITPKHLIFIDDSPDNVLGMYYYFNSNPPPFQVC